MNDDNDTDVKAKKRFDRNLIISRLFSDTSHDTLHDTLPIDRLHLCQRRRGMRDHGWEPVSRRSGTG